MDACKTIFSDFGTIDVLLNVAGGFAMGSTSYDESNEQWRSMFAINVETMRNSIKSIVPGMIQRGRGAIVNIGAYGALVGTSQLGAYCASKSSVMRLTENLSEELKFQGTNV
jgi:NADP-dependent 3-hydroxy acid dehydrogenase YdfG